MGGRHVCGPSIVPAGVGEAAKEGKGAPGGRSRWRRLEKELLGLVRKEPFGECGGTWGRGAQWIWAGTIGAEAGCGREKRRAPEPFSVCVYVTMGADRAGRNQCLGQGDESCGTNHSKLERHCSLMFWFFFFLCKGFSSWEAVRDRVRTALCILFQAFISIVFLERVRLDDVGGKD